MFIKIDNIKIELEFNKASDKTLVFLHGFGGNLNNFSYFAKVFNLFGYSTLNINLTEYGFKSLDENFTIFDYSSIIFKIFKKLNLKNISLCGHSFGGRICLILASMYKNMGINFEELILVDSAGIKPKFNLKTKIKILNYKFLKILVNLKLINKNFLLKFGSADYKTLPQNLKSVFNNVIKEDLKNLLNFINLKTLIIFGKNDKDTPLYMAKILNKEIKNSKLIVLNAGHYSYLEHKNVFINYVKNFLSNK